MMIKIKYRAVDGFRATYTYKTLKGARAKAHNLVGPHPESGGSYAISDDGIGTITIEGCTLSDLFPDEVA